MSETHKEPKKNRVLTAYIKDARYIDSWDSDPHATESSEDFVGNLYLLLEEVSTGNVIPVNLSHQTMEARLGHVMSTKDMIHFADQLRSREDPVSIEVEDREGPIDADAIFRDELKAEEEAQEQESAKQISLAPPLRSTTIKKRFDHRKSAQNSIK